MAEHSEKTASAAHTRLDYHELLDSERFNVVSSAIARFETALTAHAKDTSLLNENTMRRNHERMDGIVASITKATDVFRTVTDELHGRINAILWGAIAVLLTLLGWMAVQIFESIL